MAELLLPHDQILALRASAHRLSPVVLLGAAGLSAAALKEIDRALGAHGLVKIRAGKTERDARDAMFLAMAETLAAARVQVIGNTFVLFRPIPPAAPAPKARKKPVAGKAPARAGAPAEKTGRGRPPLRDARPPAARTGGAPRGRSAGGGSRGR